MSDTHPAAVATRTVAPFLLRLVRSHGIAREGEHAIFTPGAGLADALALAGERLDEAQRREADLCRIDWQRRHWQLSCASARLVCALNGERVLAGMTVPITAGDTLELGLLRFVVASAALAEPAFDLRELAVRDPYPAHSLDDPFGALDIAGARARPVADPLAELLCELPPRGANRREPALEPHGGISTATQQRPAHDLLDGLHDEFERVVRDPAQLAGHTDWQGQEGTVATNGAHAPSLEELSRDAAPYPMLRDILQPRERIDQVIHGFDPLGRLMPLEGEAPDEVLRLFAPDLVHGIKAAIPSLTRREHHALSPDSHMPMAQVRPADKESE